MEKVSEYDHTMTALLELVWGPDFMSPGGAGNVARLFDGLDVRDKSALDIGSGLGGPAFIVAQDYGAHVVGIGQEAADHCVECWRAMVVVCEKGEMLQVYNRGRKPTSV